MRVFHITDAFHRNYMLPIDTYKRSQTSINRRMVYLFSRRIHLGHNLSCFKLLPLNYKLLEAYILQYKLHILPLRNLI